MGDLESFLDTHATEGTRDSKGFFTLDQSRALLQLRRYQLTTPHHFVLNLMASAVASGATFMNLDYSPRRILVERDGRTFQFDQLANLFSAALIKQTDREAAMVRELAVALNGLLYFDPRWIQVVSSTRQGSIKLRMDSSQLTVQRCQESLHQLEFQGFGLEEETGERTYVEVEGLRRSLIEMVRVAVGDAEEVKLIKQRAAMNGLNLKVNGRRIELEPYFGAPLITGSYGSGFCHRWDPPALELEIDFPEVTACWLGLCHGDEAKADVILNGISYALRLPDGYYGLRAVLRDPPLVTDLSGAGLVENEEYKAVLEALKVAVGELTERLLGQLAAFDVATRWEATELLDRYAAHYLYHGDADRARAMFDEVRAARLLSRAPTSKWHQWASFYRSEGIDSEANFCYEHHR